MTTILKTVSIDPNSLTPNALPTAGEKQTQPVTGPSKRIFAWLSFPKQGVYATAQESIQEALLNNSNLLLI
jgi:hypothetical protein